MKIIFAFILTLSLANVCAAQTKATTEKIKVDFYGIDFSSVNVIGADETDDNFIAAFEGINNLMMTEANKYDVGKYLNLTVTYTDVEPAVKQIDKLNGVKFKNLKSPVISLNDIVSSYPSTDGNILIIVAKELNKSKNSGTYISVIFDGKTKNIISEKEFVGKARGFGLRNFWAGAIYDGLKNYKYQSTQSSQRGMLD